MSATPVRWEKQDGFSGSGSGQAHIHLQWLKQHGAFETPHSDRALSDHLRGVYDLLKKWGSPENVCLAGLFHSVYGTQTFAYACIPIAQRQLVKQQTGEQVERWVYLFATQKREQWFEAANGCAVSVFDDSGYATRINRADLSVLMEIELANIAEQLPYRASTSAKTLCHYESQISVAANVVSDMAYRDASEALCAVKTMG